MRAGPSRDETRTINHTRTHTHTQTHTQKTKRARELSKPGCTLSSEPGSASNSSFCMTSIDCYICRRGSAQAEDPATRRDKGGKVPTAISGPCQAADNPTPESSSQQLSSLKWHRGYDNASSRASCLRSPGLFWPFCYAGSTQPTLRCFASG